MCGGNFSRSCCIVFIWIVFSCLFTCADSFAQLAMEETVFINDYVGYEIDKAEKEKYGLFTEYADFITAEFLKKGDEYFLRITYAKEGKRLTETLVTSEVQIQAYREQIEKTEKAIKAGEQKELATDEQREGRLRIVTDALCYGLGLYGAGTIVLLELESEEASGLEMLIGGGSFMGAFKATKNYRLGYGRSKLLRWGCYAGTLYGLGIPVFFESEEEKAYFGSAMLSTPLGGLLAYKLTSHRWFEKGETDLIANGGLAGGLYGIAIPYMLNVDKLDDDWDEAKIYTASAMLCMPVGAWGTSRLIRDKDISQGRAHLMTLGGILGAYYGAGTLRLIGVDANEHERAYVASAALGLPVGVYLGYKFTGKEQYTLGRAMLISVGTYAGALIGIGLIRVSGVDEEHPRPYILATMLGSAAGLFYTHDATRGWSEKLTSAINSRLPDDVTVSLPSYGDLLCYGAMTLCKSSSAGSVPIELVKVSF